MDQKSVVFVLMIAQGVAIGLPALGGELVVTLDDVAGEIRDRNPSLRAARWIVAEASGKARQAGRLRNPEFEAEAEMSTGVDEGAVLLSLTQRFPVTGRLRLEREAGEIDVRRAEQEVLEVTNQLIAEGRAEVVRLMGVEQRLTLLGRQEAVLEELAVFIEGAAERGEASLLDAGQARLERSRLLAERRRLLARKQQRLGVLKELLGVDPDGSVRVAGVLSEPVDPRAADGSARPALKAAQFSARQAAKEVEVERAKRFEDVGLGLFGAIGREVETLDEPVPTDGFLGFRVSIPLPLWDRNDGNIEAAQARAERGQAEVAAITGRIARETAAARAEMRQWAQLAAEIKQVLLPQADEQAGFAEEAWRNGQSGLLTVFRSREQQLELAAARLDALENFHLARVRYQMALGLPQNY